jgi:hypothetical protein
MLLFVGCTQHIDLYSKNEELIVHTIRKDKDTNLVRVEALGGYNTDPFHYSKYLFRFKAKKGEYAIGDTVFDFTPKGIK